MEDLANAVLKAIELYEDSWNGMCHDLSKEEAADKATNLVGLDESGIYPVYVMITKDREGAIGWALQFKKDEKDEQS